MVFFHFIWDLQPYSEQEKLDILDHFHNSRWLPYAILKNAKLRQITEFNSEKSFSFLKVQAKCAKYDLKLND